MSPVGVDVQCSNPSRALLATQRHDANPSVRTLWVLLPYVLAKMCIAANTAFQEYLYGLIGGSSLAAEADTYHLLFLWMGSCMGALRASSVLVARHFNAVRSGAPDGGSYHGPLSPCMYLEQALRGTGSLDDGGERTPAASVNGSNSRAVQLTPGAAERRCLCHAPLFGSSLALAVGVASAVGFLYTDRLLWFAVDTTPGILHAVSSFGGGFWWGGLPTLLLYQKGQVLLGLGCSMLVLLYAGILYAGLGTYLAWLWYENNGARGIGMSLSVSAWVAYGALKLHTWADPRIRSGLGVHVNAEQVLWCLVNRRTGNAEGRAALCTAFIFCVMADRELHQAAAQYVFLAVPLGLSNMLSLLRQLVVAAVVTECDADAATAYSISSAYYDTAEVGLLAVSSVVAALIAHDGRTYWKPACATVCCLSVIIGLVPILAPVAVSHLFGGQVYAYGTAEVDAVIGAVKNFNVLNFAAFLLATVSMTASAVLHGRLVAWVPLLINVAANVGGIVWAAVASKVTTQKNCAWSVGGSLTANFLSVVVMIPYVYSQWAFVMERAL